MHRTFPLSSVPHPLVVVIVHFCLDPDIEDAHSAQFFFFFEIHEPFDAQILLNSVITSVNWDVEERDAVCVPCCSERTQIQFQFKNVAI